MYVLLSLKKKNILVNIYLYLIFKLKKLYNKFYSIFKKKKHLLKINFEQYNNNNIIFIRRLIKV